MYQRKELFQVLESFLKESSTIANVSENKNKLTVTFVQKYYIFESLYNVFAQFRYFIYLSFLHTTPNNFQEMTTHRFSLRLNCCPKTDGYSLYL